MAANRALEEMKEAQAELTMKIAESQQENQFLKEAQRKMQYDPCNPEKEENDMYDEVRRPETDHPRQKLRWRN